LFWHKNLINTKSSAFINRLTNAQVPAFIKRFTNAEPSMFAKHALRLRSRRQNEKRQIWSNVVSHDTPPKVNEAAPHFQKSQLIPFLEKV
jgi:hypothetical protein